MSKIYKLIMLLFFVANIKANAQTYCTPVYGTGATQGTGSDDYIAGVQLNTIINLNSNVAGSPSYVDYTSTLSTTLTSGQTYSMTITGSPYASGETYAVFIDYDDNGDFSGANESIYQSAISTIASQVFNFSFTIPVGINPVNTRMRVMNTYSTTAFVVVPCPTNYVYGETEDYAIDIVSPAPPYCLPSYSSGTSTGDYISGFQLNTISNLNSTVSGGPSYTNYTSIYNTSLTAGSVYPVTIIGSTYASGEIYAIFIDYNADGDFLDANESVYQSAISNVANQVFSFNITIPIGTNLGTTRMRVVNTYSTIALTVASCPVYTYGETEDYSVTIVSPVASPVANFSTNFSSISLGGSTNFFDLCTNNPTSWSWSFPGGLPATSTLKNPTNIVYNATGCYDVTLTATNVFGSNTITVPCFINVLPIGQQYCLPNPTNGTTGGDFINSVSLGGISNLNTGSNTGASYSYINTMSADLTVGVLNTLTIQNGTWASDTISVWIDYNSDGDFADIGEKIDQISTSVASTNYFINFTVASTVAGGLKVMRIRISDNSAAIANADPCTDYLYGETEDYIVNIVQQAAPIADFSANTFNIIAGQSVTFFDLSANAPTSWLWSFPGATVTSSTAQNPTVTYNAAGTYNVTLTATNAYGSNTFTYNNIIIVTTTSIYCINNLHSVDCNAGNNINNVSITNTTLSVLNSGCSNGSELGYTFWSPINNGTATLAKGTTYTFNVTSTVSSIISVWIDFNHDGTFATTEWKQIATASTANVAASNTFLIPTTALTGSTRMRVRTRNVGSVNGNSDACTSFGSGETEDFTITIVNNATLAPVASFVASSTTVSAGQTVSFVDLSSNSPTSWNWTFAGGTPSSSTVQNPTITYNTPGAYAVSLTATNSAGFNSFTQTAYITVLNAATLSPMGSSANIYTALVEQSNCLTANQDLNAIMFTRRKNTGDAGNSGYVQSSYSTNGGVSFDSTLTIATDATNLSRYPSGAIFNPTGNTTVGNALSVVSGPFIQSATATWLGNYFASSKLNNTANNQLFYNNSSLPAGQLKSDYARYGIESNSSSVVVCGARFLDANATTTLGQGFSGAVIHRGAYNSASSQFVWTPKYIRHSFARNPLDNSALAISTPLSAWSANGTIGYLVFIGVDSVGRATLTNKRFQPIVYKTTNSGTTWNQMPITNFGSIANISSFLTPTYAGTKAPNFSAANGFDVTVDITNNLHIVSVIQSSASEHIDSLDYTWNSPKQIFDVYTTTTGWNAMLLDSINTDVVDAISSSWQASDGTGGSGWGARLQISKSSDGKRLFYGWADTEPIWGTTINLNPDIFVKGYNVETNLLTNTKNFTSTNATISGKSYFHYISNISLKSGTTYTIPASVVKSRSNTFDAIGAVQHLYVKNIQFSDIDFTMAPPQGVTSNPVASFNYFPTSACVGSPVTFSNTSTNATSYTWTFQGGIPSTSTSASPDVVWTTSGTKTITLVASNGTTTNTATQTITVNAVPAANAGNSVTICSGLSTNLLASGGNSYAWSPTTGLSNPNIANPVASPTQTTTYTVTVSNGNCTSIAQVTVNVNSSLSLTTSGNTSICSGGNTQISATSVIGASYSWSPSTGLNSSNTQYPIASPTSTTTYTVAATNNGCSAISSVTVAVNNSPTVNLGNSVNVCSGSSTTLNAGNSGSTFSWSPSTGLNNTNTQSVVASPTATTTYIATVTNSSGCSASGTVTVNVINVNATAGQNVTICNGSSTALSATGGTTYSWSPSAGLNTTSAQSVTASPSQTTTYTVTATTSGCSATSSVIVNVNSVIANAGNDVTVCAGQSAQLIASGGTSYSWSPSSGLSSASVPNPTVLTSSTTTYTVTVTNGSCTASDVVVYNVTSINANAGNNANICLGSSTQLAASGGTSYSWSPSTGLNSTTIANPVATPSATTTYTVIAITNGCSNTASVTVNVNTANANAGNDVTICTGNSVQLGATGGVSYSWSPSVGLSSTNVANPVATPTTTTTYLVTATSGSCVTTDFVTVNVANSLNVSAGNNQTLCSGQTLQLNASGGAQYSWSPLIGLSNSNIANPIASPASTTTYTVTTFSGTCSSSAQVTITVVPGITANAGSNITLCNGASAALNATGGTSYSWSPATGLSNASVSNPIAFPTTTTTYIVTATTGGCSASDTIIVNVGSLTANAGIDVALCAGQNSTLLASGGTGYSWSPTTGLSNANSANPVASPSATTVYTVTVTSGNCTATDNVTVSISSVSVNAGQSQQICNGNSTILNAQGSNVTNYSWTPTNGLSNPNIANPTASPTSTTLYTVVATDGLCVSSSTVNVVVNNNPANPIITSTANGLTTTNAVLYQWLLNGLPVSNATTQQIIPSTNGSYSVVVTNGNGCSAVSLPFSVITVSIEDIVSNSTIDIYPNPVSEILNIEFSKLNDNATIELMDMRGRNVLNEKITLQHSTFDISTFDAGVYFVRIKTAKQNIVKRIIKQ